MRNFDKSPSFNDIFFFDLQGLTRNFELPDAKFVPKFFEHFLLGSPELARRFSLYLILYTAGRFSHSSDTLAELRTNIGEFSLRIGKVPGFHYYFVLEPLVRPRKFAPKSAKRKSDFL